jgi:hypothetical protein
MAGELYLGAVQIGKETTAGTGVAATRKLYTAEPRLNPGITNRFHDFATGTRSATRAVTPGPKNPDGQYRFPMSSEEILEPALLGIKGGVTPTTPAGTVRLWTFTEGVTLESATVELYDGAREWEMYGAQVSRIAIEGDVEGDNMVTVDLFGLDFAQATLTAALSDRVPTFFEGWESKLYITAYGGTPGAGEVTTFLKSWSVTLDNQMARKRLAGNTQAATRTVPGTLAITGSLTYEAAEAQALTEYTNLVAATKRLIRLEFGQNSVIETTYKTFVTLDIPCAWESQDLGQTDAGTRMYQANFRYVYDTTNAFGFQLRAQSTRTAAY